MSLLYYPIPKDDEVQIRMITRKIVSEKVRPFATQDDEAHFFRRDIFNTFAKLGYVAMTVSKEYGGLAASHRLYYAFIEELARGSLAQAVTAGVSNLVQGALTSFGSEEQKKQYLTKLTAGTYLGAFSLSEPGSGSDAASLRCAAKKVSGGYTVTGTKVWCSNAGLADLYLLMARTSGEGADGITAFLVPKETKGFRVGKEEKKLGIWSSTLCELIFENCFLPDAQRIGEEGEGFKVALSQLDAGRVGIAVSGLGLAMEALEHLWKYRLLEQKNGRDFPEGVQHRFATHYSSIQAVKSLVWDIAEARDAKEKITLLASHAKLLSSDTAMQVTSDAVEFMEYNGYVREYEAERFMRDAKALQIVEGTNQVQRLVIARDINKQLES